MAINTSKKLAARKRLQTLQREEAHNKRLATAIAEQLSYSLREISREILRELKPKPEEVKEVIKHRYSCTINKRLQLGSARSFYVSISPERGFTPDRLVMNAPCYGFITIKRIWIGDTLLVGGSEDAFSYSASNTTMKLSVPYISEYDEIQLEADYNGMCPAPFCVSAPYLFCATFQGEAQY